MDIRHVFAANVRRLRHAASMTQEELAYDAGINRSYMSRLETGRTWVGLKMIAQIARVLKVEPADLLKMPERKSRRRA